MPIDELGSGFLAAVFRFLGWIFVDVIIEILIKGLGYLICRPFKKVDIDSFIAVIVGLLAWAALIALVVLASGWL